MESAIWQGNTRAAKALQESLQSRVRIRPLNRPPTLIGGADISCNRFSKTVYAGIVVLNYRTLEVVERRGIVEEISFPYIPGFLSFREVPSLLKVWQSLTKKPDVVMLDGHGILHPRKMGVATHFGIEAEVPTMGCAKKRLVGTHADIDPAPGSIQPIHVGEELRGYLLQSRNNANPIYLSPGTHMSCSDALEIGQHCLRGYRLPEPTRQAHLYVNELRVAQRQESE